MLRLQLLQLLAVLLVPLQAKLVVLQAGRGAAKAEPVWAMGIHCVLLLMKGKNIRDIYVVDAKK